MQDPIPDLYKIIPFSLLRKTEGVRFDTLEPGNVPKIDAIDRVMHEGGAISPGSVGDVQRPWYMHQHQDDNLMVFHGVRYVDLYTPKHGKIESFVVTPYSIHHDGELLYDGSAMLVWPRYVFHRLGLGQPGHAL